MTTRIVNNGSYYATGRRKESSARVFLTEGTGKALINSKTLEEYFGRDTIWLKQALRPLELIMQQDMFDLMITVKGGGVNGQSGAVSLGIARALDLYAKKNAPEITFEESEVESNENSEETGDTDTTAAPQEDGPLGVEKWHRAIRKAGLLTRDSRRVLRKKVGLVKARKAKQFSKR